MYRYLRLRILSVLYHFKPTRVWVYKRLPRHRSGYRHYWVDDKANILGMRQRIAELPAVDNYPTIPELFDAINKFHVPRIGKVTPLSVLEVGCGYGRLMAGLEERYGIAEFVLEGCDVSEELIQQAKAENLLVFQHDIVMTPLKKKWDVVYTRAVFMFMIDHYEDTFTAMKHLDEAAIQKVIIYEWPHVCDYMRSVYPSSKFEYHSTPVWAG